MSFVYVMHYILGRSCIVINICDWYLKSDFVVNRQVSLKKYNLTMSWLIRENVLNYGSNKV